MLSHVGVDLRLYCGGICPLPAQDSHQISIFCQRVDVWPKFQYLVFIKRIKYTFIHSLSLTCPECLLAGDAPVAWLTDAATGGPRENRDPVVSAGGAATRIKLLQIFIQSPLQVGYSDSCMVSSSAEAHNFINWHHLRGHRSEPESEAQESPTM